MYASRDIVYRLICYKAHSIAVIGSEYLPTLILTKCNASLGEPTTYEASFLDDLWKKIAQDRRREHA